MSRPHARLIGTLLLLLTIRASSSSVSRRLSNDDFSQFFGAPSNSTEDLVASKHTFALPTTTSQGFTANPSDSPYMGEEELIRPNNTERNFSYRVETPGLQPSVDLPVAYSSFELFPEIQNKDTNNPWHLTYSRFRRNSSYENEITKDNSNTSVNYFQGNNNLNEGQTYRGVLINDTRAVVGAQKEDRLSTNPSQSPTGFRILRERSGFTSPNLNINKLSWVRLSPSSGGVGTSIRRRYPRYQLQSQYPSHQQESRRWPGHRLSQDPNYHPISDARSGTRPLFQTQTSFISPFEPRSQSVAQEHNSMQMQQYLWSLYEAKNEASPLDHGDSSSNLNNQYPPSSRYSSSRRQQVTVLTPSPPHTETYNNHRHLTNSSRSTGDLQAGSNQNFKENHRADPTQSQSDRSRALYQDNRNSASGGNHIYELTTAASGGDADGKAHAQQVISAEDRDEDDDSDEDADDITSSLSDATNLRVGKSLNIFSRYGFLTLSIKVRPPVGVDNYLFMENTAEVFQKNSYWSKRERRRHTGRFDDHFYIHFCENLNELLIAYFDHFTIEGVPKAHKAFTASLSVRDLARQFGINSSFLRGRFSFVLVRLFRRKMRKTLKGPQTMQSALDAALRSIRIGSEESVHRFVDRFGTHIIKEFEVGDMMYQTFVFGERIYKQLKNTFVTVGSESHLEQLQLYFSPRFATNVGNIQLASGNGNLTNILEGWSVIPEQILYPTIFKVFDDPAVETELEQLEGEVVLSLKLDKITTRLPPTAATRWMSEVLDNSLALYYHNLDSTRDTT